jgi:hypothetical protein
VHSDIGGGYYPKEQGKGKDETGMDMLSRLPLAHMYRAARLAGAPLKLELVTQQSVKDDFKIAPETIAAFNHYLTYARTRSGPLTDIMREQRNFYIQWRHLRRQRSPAPLEGTASYEAARQEDKNDLHSANEEFTQEIADFEHWRDNYLNSVPPESHPYGWSGGPRRLEESEAQMPGFDNDRYNEWKEIARFWNREFLPEGMDVFFDDYVHDSRAWFKLAGAESDDVEGELQAWLRKLKEYEARKKIEGDSVPFPLGRDEYRWAKMYERTGKVPPMKNGGREPAWSGAGYLRYRKVYAGGDRILISQEEHRFSDSRLAANSPVDKAKAA